MIKGMLKRLLNRRSLLGTLFFLVFVGELTVGRNSGLYTPPGLVALLLLYFCYFHLFDALVAHYRMNRLGVVLVNFALYSVLITGLLHSEISSYVEHPEDGLIITLIRIQCSLFPLFAYRLLERVAPRTNYQSLSVRTAVLLFAAYILILTPTHQFGIGSALHAIAAAPMLSAAFVVAALVALAVGLRTRAVVRPRRAYARFTIWSLLLGILALIPSIPVFLILLAGMIMVGVYYLMESEFRTAAPV